MKHLGKLCLALAFVGLSAMPLSAQEWPARTVTILVPYPAGGVADAVARAAATQATTELKQSFVVENRTGASGRIALDQLIRAEPDGYTLALAVPALLSLLPITDPKYVDLDKKFTPITIAVETYFGLAINPQKTPAQNFQELMSSTKARSGQLTYSSAGAGTSYHFWSEAILKEAGINALHVPYRGEAPATTDLLAGIVDFTLVTGAGKGLADDGRIKILAVSAQDAWDIYPGAPSLNAVGIKQAVAAGWLGFMGPPGMSKELVAKVNGAFLSALKRPEVLSMLSAQGYTVVASAPDAMPAVIAKEQGIFRDLLKSGRVKLEQ
ncbi:tripartite tricarboxylate transporter substrate binding protein [Methylocella sp. CPCC 101449]|uniref:Bug family tripartite tricarboxylate transporter substrate binding protein n=1 Tax=Methylocella sp. CPCC 101449 TaxID=2987531 RepID=UPI002891FE25|nr:tripartite tricarboxylate transporter substrate binding protein [Methylocella sp. CPCC 101449]MDT2024170.1 tripartite tricarboxylate transporter substrate binding protein [Methylocella sp. CPCC 101449]